MTKRRLKVEDLSELVSVTQPTLAPNQQEAVFVQTKIDEKENTYQANLWHVNLETKAITQWTHGKEKVSSPLYSEDGTKLAFLSTRDDKNQLYVLSTEGGEARKITSFEKGVSSFKWSPCGKKIWFLASLKEGKNFIDVSDDEEDKKKKPEPYIVDKMKYKMDGTGLLPQNTYKHIGFIDLETEESTQFTQGNHDYDLQDISNDGKKIVFSVNRSENQDFEFHESLYLIDVESRQETTIIEDDGSYGGAVFSFDDKKLAFVGSEVTYQIATHAELYVYDVESGSRHILTEGIDAPVGDYVVADHQQGVTAPSVKWTKENHLYFQVSTMGDVRLYASSLEGEMYPATGGDEHIYGYDVAKSGEFTLVTVSNPTKIGELYLQTIATGERQQLTSFNEKFENEVELVPAQAIVFKGSKNWDVHGWLMKPAGYVDGQKYPLIVEIHGGPHAMYANTFFHELQLMASQGYGVLYINPRGSHGYSQQFVDAVRDDYGGGDYEDIMAALDSVLANNVWIDDSRLGVAGGSYGGFMTNWIVSHTNRFKAAVTQRSISNWVSFFGVSDIGYYFSDWEIGADMTDVEKLWNHSPLKYAENIQTPLLILHSEKDFRCPIEQAEQLFITLKQMKKEVGFIRFPDSDHNLSRSGYPNLRYARLEQIISWFNQYL